MMTTPESNSLVPTALRPTPSSVVSSPNLKSPDPNSPQPPTLRPVEPARASFTAVDPPAPESHLQSHLHSRAQPHSPCSSSTSRPHSRLDSHPPPLPASRPASPAPATLFDPLPPLPSRLRQASLKLVPPPNFGFVETWLYRSGEPAELSFAFLSRLELRTLLWLAPRPPSPPFRDFLVSAGVTVHDLGIQHAATIDAVTDEAVTEALRLILSPQIYPLMIMCAGGSHRTGTVVGCLRKLQGWNLASIFEEYRRYAGAQHHIMNEQFIEFYHTRRLTGAIGKEEEEEKRVVAPVASQVLGRATPAGEMSRGETI
ncbi:hypothetical protein CROQUDRAFT_131330 [Cronartium quercuum f. sp. fusiforme G11]|uniref:Putative tyrosine-protein phosphatase OCA1 n=1 Tax=Cronartium quercuum f. sp. fusiforme G11 TaxID=708437 RepID=A0A9P6TF05_9BASI|nr:hypothetical protein CROQUDRAFT_131330 [Cronartium quercuum f. sp. fusiforme G11]